VILHDTVLKHKKKSESSALEINLTHFCSVLKTSEWATKIDFWETLKVGSYKAWLFLL